MSIGRKMSRAWLSSGVRFLDPHLRCPTNGSITCLRCVIPYINCGRTECPPDFGTNFWFPMQVAYCFASLISDSSGCFYANIIIWTYLKYSFKNVCLIRMLRDITKTTLKIKMLSCVICHCTATAVICHTCAGLESCSQITSINASNE